MANKQLAKNSNQIVCQEAHYRGPIPLPSMLAEYEAILPGSADRILTMAENQSAHRIEIEKIAIKARARDSLLGIVAGFLIGVSALGASAFVIVNGHTFAGGLIGTTGLAGLVGVFIYGTRENKAERERKSQPENKN